MYGTFFFIAILIWSQGSSPGFMLCPKDTLHTMYICIIPIVNRYMYLSSCSLYSSSKLRVFKFQPETVNLTDCNNSAEVHFMVQ